MKKLHVNFIFYMFIAATSGCTIKDDQLVQLGKSAVSAILKDPESAKFNDIFTSELGDSSYGAVSAICGSVNGKNSLGAYVGATRFVSIIKVNKDGTQKVLETVLDTTGAQGPVVGSFEVDYWNVYCSKKNI